MLFSSITFLVYFLPLLLTCYYITPIKWRNYTLLLFSILFYMYGEPNYVFLLLCLCVFNYYMAVKQKLSKHKKTHFLFAISANLVILVYFKYFDFLIGNLNAVFHTEFSFVHVAMPIGVSFFIFQSISYLVDVYRQKSNASNTLSGYMLYIMMFPQLIAGPIVRYRDISSQLSNRMYVPSQFNQGVFRFVIGLSKKVVLADTFGVVCETLTQTSELYFIGGWMYAMAATFQVYFDFSGYSDMAIGLGKMLGFQLPENFNYPLTAIHITEFWKRWHMTLSSWFKDYVYLPLGGNRKGIQRQILNICIVWGLTGLWHGAAWNFILWGLWFAVILIIEKLGLKKRMEKHRFVGHCYTVCIVCISFTIFKIEDATQLMEIVKHMVSFQLKISSELAYYIQNYAMYFVVAVIASTPVFTRLFKSEKIGFIKCMICIALFVLCMGYLVDGTYHPFLYFRF